MSIPRSLLSRSGLVLVGLPVAFLSAQSVPSPEIESGIASVSSAPIRALEAKSATLQKYAKLPLSFERHGESEFVARGQGYVMDIHGARATIAVPVSGVSINVGMEFIHGRQVAAIPEKELPGKVNYIVGNDPRRWRLGLPTYEQVTYHDLYPGIDVTYYGNQKQLEFDLVLKPGADVRSIRMRFSGAAKLHRDPYGSLTLGDLRLMVPTVLQGKKNIAARYKVLGSGEVAFELGAYDRRAPLIIDPTLVYSTRLGGGNGGNQGNAIALDASGNAYIAGYTAAADFPVVSPAYAGYQANTDSFISKVNSTGTALIYSTYIGGSGFDYLRGIAVDSTGAAWAVGYTSSPDFPLLSPYQNTYGGGDDAFVVKLSPNGALVYSTFLGGSAFDSANSVAVDPFGNAYVTGEASAGFPTTAGVYQPVNQGSFDAFVTKYSSSGSLVWSTFVGGTNFDYANGIAVDQFGNSYITGATYSTSFPNVPPGGAQPINMGSGDAFAAKLNFNGSGLLYFTFLGGSGYDQANAIGVDPISGIAVVAGQTTSADLSTTPVAVQLTNAGGYDGFVAKLNAAGSAFVYTTYLGGTRSDFINALGVDPKGNAYVAGYTHSNNFPTKSPIQPAIQGNSISLFRTSNMGATWTPFDANIPGTVSAVLPDPVNAGTIIVSTENGIYRTTNNGSTWTQQSLAGNLSLSRSPANAATIYGVSGTSIYQSTDSGITWSLKGSVPLCCASGIVADPSNAGTAYLFGFSAFGVQKTVNNGTNWTTLNTGFPANQNVRTMVAGSDGSLYAGLDSALEGVNAGGVYKSTNQGATWVLVTNSFNVPPQGLAVAPSDPSILYVTDYFSLYESTNGGTNWSRSIGSLPGATNALAISPTKPTALYYAAYDSTAPLWTSTNSGVTWNPAAGLGVASLNRIVPDPLSVAGAYAIATVSIVPIVAKIDSSGLTLLYSTYLGDYGDAFGIATNGTGDAFVTGSTWDFPTSPSALQRNRNLLYNSLDGFVARISDATPACSYSVDPQQSLEVWYTHTVQYVVTAPSGCSWTASSNQPWATIVSGASGTGSGIVYVLANNTANSSNQTATLTIAGQSISLRQQIGNCFYSSISPDSAVVSSGGGTVQFNVLDGAGCDWKIVNNDPSAISIVSGASGTGNGTAIVSVAANAGPNTRTFKLFSVQGGSETISQAGTIAPAVIATITSSPSGASITTLGNGCIPGTYTTPASLTWNANTNCTINFTTPQIIGGTQYVFNSATVNGGASTTTNPLTVNSGSSALTVNGNFMNPCSYSLSPTGTSLEASAHIFSFTVTTAPACTWTATPSDTWITILPSGSQGTGTVNYAAAANNGGARTGAISVGGQIYTIHQQGFSCPYSIVPAVAAFDANGGDSRVVVTAPAGCSWTATSNAGWLTVTSGASGAGSGAVIVHASSTAGGPRSGTVTIAGQTFSVTQAAPGASACGAIDVTSQVAISDAGHNRWTPPNLYSGSITVRNNSGSVIHGPVYLVLVGEPTHYGFPNDSLLLGTQPVTTCFTSQGDYLLPVSGDLQPGQTAGYSTGWITQTFGRIGYSVKVLSGTPSH